MNLPRTNWTSSTAKEYFWDQICLQFSQSCFERGCVAIFCKIPRSFSAEMFRTCYTKTVADNYLSDKIGDVQMSDYLLHCSNIIELRKSFDIHNY